MLRTESKHNPDFGSQLGKLSAALELLTQKFSGVVLPRESIIVHTGGPNLGQIFYLRVQARALIGPITDPAIQALIYIVDLAYPLMGTTP